MSRFCFSLCLLLLFCAHASAAGISGSPEFAGQDPAGAAAAEVEIRDFPVNLAFPGKGVYSAVFTTRLVRPENSAGDGADTEGTSSEVAAVQGEDMVLRSVGAAAQTDIIRVFREYARRAAARKTGEGGGSFRGRVEGGSSFSASVRSGDMTPTSSPEAAFLLPPLETAGWTIRPGGGLGTAAYGSFVVGGLSFRLTMAGRGVNMESYFSAWGTRYSKLVDPSRPENVFYALPLGMDSNEAVFFYLYKGTIYQLRFILPPTAPVPDHLEKILPVAYGLIFGGQGDRVGDSGDNRSYNRAACVDDFGVTRALWDAASIRDKRRFLVRMTDFMRRTMHWAGRFDLSDPDHRPGLEIIELRDGLPLFEAGEAEHIPEGFDRGGGQLDRMVDLLIRASGPRGATFSPARFLDACIGVVYSPDRTRGDRYLFLMDDRAVFFVPPHGGRPAVFQDMPYARFGTSGSPMRHDGEYAVFAGDKAVRSRALSEFAGRLFQGGEKTFVALFRCPEAQGGPDSGGRPEPDSGPDSGKNPGRNSGLNSGQ